MKAAEDYLKTFVRIIAAEGYIPKEVFNCDKTDVKENLYNSRGGEDARPQTQEEKTNPCTVHQYEWWLQD